MHFSSGARRAKGQTAVALTTLEAELIACSDGTREAGRLKRLLNDLGGVDPDLSSANILPQPGSSKLIHSVVIRAKAKHIDVKHLHAHDEQEEGNLQFSYIKSENDLADLFTKALQAQTPNTDRYDESERAQGKTHRIAEEGVRLS